MKIEKLITNMLLFQSSTIIIMEPKIGRPPIIAFSGTQNYKDLLLYDIDIRPKFWPIENKGTEDGGNVHRGFARRTSNLMDQITNFTDKYDNFVIGGHSLGGSCAVLCASKLTNMNKTVKAIYTFGMPKTASNKFRTFYMKQELWDKTFNYITPNDFVVKLPITYKSLGNDIILDFKNENGIISHDLLIYDDLL